MSLYATKTFSKTETSDTIKTKLENLKSLIEQGYGNRSDQVVKLQTGFAELVQFLDGVPDKISEWQKSFQQELKKLQDQLEATKLELQNLQSTTSSNDIQSKNMQLQIAKQKDEISNLELQIESLKIQAASADESDQQKNLLQNQLNDIADEIERLQNFVQQQNDKKVVETLSNEKLKEKIRKIDELLKVNKNVL